MDSFSLFEVRLWRKSAFHNWLQVERQGGSARQRAQAHVIRLISGHVLVTSFSFFAARLLMKDTHTIGENKTSWKKIMD